MKKFLLMLTLSLLLFGCDRYFNSTFVDQSITDDQNTHVLFKETGTGMMTSVFFKGKIVKVYYDDSYFLNDSIIILRQQQGEVYIKMLKKMKSVIKEK